MKNGTYCVMLDCSRNGVMNVSALKKFVKIISSMGYNAIMLYTEDTYEVVGEEYFGLFRGKYTIAEIKEIDAYALSLGVELIPCIQTLAHLDTLLRWHAYESIADTPDCLLVGEEKTYELIEKMISSISNTFSSKRIHLGLDETFNIGKGKFFDKNGYAERSEIFAKHYSKVVDIAQKHGFSPIVWGDMLVDFELKANCTTVCWDYYTEDKNIFGQKLKSHLLSGDDVWYAGGVISWLGFAPYNQFSSNVLKEHLCVCKENGINNFIVTLWGDDGKECSYFSTLPALFSAIKYWQFGEVESYLGEFENIVGVSYSDMLMLDEVNNIGEKIKWQNPNKYLLYQDVLLGIYDSTVSEIYPSCFANTAKKLELCAKNKVFGYLFNTLASLCRVLEVKCSIGKRTRNAYKSKDKNALRELLTDYLKLIELLNAFYEKFRTLWQIENKTVGFEVMDIRLGGLIMRIKNAERTVRDFLDGRIEKIDELEEATAVYYSDEFIGKAIYAPNYKDIVSANRI